MLKSYHDSKVLVTGASSGIGLEFAKQLTACGAQVIGVARRGVPDHGNIVSIPLDLTKNIEGLIQTHQPDILINNAGFGLCGKFETLNLEEQLRMIYLNVVATTSLAHQFMQFYRDTPPTDNLRKIRGIINVSSIGAVAPLPLLSVYSATKAYNLNFSLAAGQEARQYGLTSLAVCPGPVKTNFGVVAKYRQNVSFWGTTPEKVVKEVLVRYLKINASKTLNDQMFPSLKGKIIGLLSRLTPRKVGLKIIHDIIRKDNPEIE